MTRVLFVCVRNAGKSQLAAGLLRRLLADQHTDGIHVASAGTQPGAGLNALTVQALAELGIDITDQAPVQLTDQLISGSDLVVTLGSEAQVPALPGPDYRTWLTDEPSGRGVEGLDRMRIIRDDIARHVSALHDDLVSRAS